LGELGGKVNKSMSAEEFEKLVQEAVAFLPETIRQKMDNVAIVTEPGRPGGPLWGLYQGVPKTAYGRGFGMQLPDKITIFQLPIENSAGTPSAVKELVQEVVWHEIGHHFGFGEKEIRELERKRKKK
jgi:predicted Zn-dependent protease with MMP-like domain